MIAVMLLGFVTFLVVGGGGGEAQGEGSTPPAASGRYNPEVRRLFLEECIRASQGATAYCACTLEKLEAAYSQAEYIQFSDNVDDTKSKRIIREISQSCRAAE